MIEFIDTALLLIILYHVLPDIKGKLRSRLINRRNRALRK